MNISENLYYLRKRDGITQEELAEKLSVSRQSVSKWETGEAYPETEKLITICEIFNVSLDDLMRGSINDEHKIVKADDKREKRKNSPSLFGAIFLSIMLAATILSMLLLFVWKQDLFWLPFPIGGIVCGIVKAILSVALKPQKDDNGE